jgi:hypothetical protein
MAGIDQSVKLYRIQVRYNKRAIRGQAPTEFYVLVQNEKQLDKALRRYAKVAKSIEPKLVAVEGREMPSSLGCFIDMREKRRSDQP